MQHLSNYSTFSHSEMTPLKQPNSYEYLGLFLDFLFCFTGLSTHVPVPQYFNGLIFGRINSLQVAFLLGILMAILFYVFFLYTLQNHLSGLKKICIFIGLMMKIQRRANWLLLWWCHSRWEHFLSLFIAYRNIKCFHVVFAYFWLNLFLVFTTLIAITDGIIFHYQLLTFLYTKIIDLYINFVSCHFTELSYCL